MNATDADPWDAASLQSLSDALGDQCLPKDQLHEFATAMLRHRGSDLRVRHGCDPSSLPFSLAPVPWYPLGYRDEGSQTRPSRTLDYAAGEFFLQDAGSMLALAACDADRLKTEGRLVCDLCAAPGGKASALLESIGDGFLLANEPIKSRLAPLGYNLARTGIGRYAISSLDPESLAQRLAGVFDLVLVDAPCSGQALLGRGKQSMSSIAASQVEHSAARARRILGSAVQLLRPGGQLVFSTCTFAEAENESQVAWMLEQHDCIANPRDRLQPYASDTTGCSYRLWPHRDGCAGGFAASVQSSASSSRSDSGNAMRTRRRKLKDRLPPEIMHWFETIPSRYQVSENRIGCLPDDAPEWVESVAKQTPELAYRTGQTWKPAHAMALRRDGLMTSTRVVEIEADLATRFMAGQPIPCGTKGWCVVRYQGRPLGWVKASSGTGKNHLPTAARLVIET